MYAIDTECEGLKARHFSGYWLFQLHHQWWKLWDQQQRPFCKKLILDPKDLLWHWKLLSEAPHSNSIKWLQEYHNHNDSMITLQSSVWTFFCAYVELNISDELCLIPDVRLVTENKLVDYVTVFVPFRQKVLQDFSFFKTFKCGIPLSWNYCLSFDWLKEREQIVNVSMTRLCLTS